MLFPVVCIHGHPEKGIFPQLRRPQAYHQLTPELISQSKDMAASAEAAAFPPAPKRAAVRRMAPAAAGP